MTTQRHWLTPQAHHRLRNELTALLAPARGRRVPDQARDLRIREISDLLTNADDRGPLRLRDVLDAPDPVHERG
ncbi:hypothetical protein ABZX92_34930, partial [Lentzea sp. NPDC006480]